MKQDSAFLTPHPREITNLIEPAILKRLQKEKRGQGVGK
ncbi:heteromeric transposase endonuclease subunit TnsA, partial [Vibrio anguillarum]|nr:heteromeric transposase endonuclease subunit TnsA [Vibrio anguillarum]